MKIENMLAWSVSLSRPRGEHEKTKWGSHANEHVTAVAPDPVAAAELVYAEYPGAKIYSINNVGSKTILLVAVPPSELPGEGDPR